MKRIKKLVAVMLAAIMVMSLGSVNVMAAGEYTITVNSSLANRTYTAYQLFTGTMKDGSLTNATAGTGIDIWDSTSGYPNEDATKIANLTNTMKKSTEAISVTDADGNSYTTLGALFTAKLSADASAAAIANVLATYGKDETNGVMVAFAKEVAAYKLASAAISVNTTSSNTPEGGTTTYSYSFTGLDAGYYLIVDDTGTVGDNEAYSRYMLIMTTDENNKTVTITSKEDVPTLTKTLADGSDTASATVGDTLTYKITTSIPDTTGYSSYTYTITDTLSKGLKLETGTTGGASSGLTPLNITIQVADGEILYGFRLASADDQTSTGDYKFYYYTSTSGGDTTLTIVIKDFLTLTAGATTSDSIVTTYTAKLTSDAVIGSDGNDNTAYLTYSNNPNGTSTSDTSKDKVTVYTFEMDFTKVDVASPSNTLSGAKFILYYTDDETDTTYYAIADATFTTSGSETEAGSTTSENTYTITAWTTTQDDATTLISGSDGVIKVKGLGAGTFYLKETAAPSGYVLWTTDAPIIITAETDPASAQTLSATVDGTYAAGNFTTGIITSTITNSSSSTIPGTGGIGTTIFYVVGAILVLGAAVVLITRRRMAGR